MTDESEELVAAEPPSVVDDETEGQAPHQGPIPPYNEAVRYSEASWTDAYHSAVRAVRADWPHAGLVETIAASEADWRWTLIVEGDHSRAIFPLDIQPPDLNSFKAECIQEMMQYAHDSNYNLNPSRPTPIWLWGKHRFPASEEFHQALCGLIANQIASYRARNLVYEAQLITLDGREVILPDRPGAGYGKDKDEPIVYLSDMLDARRRIIKRVTTEYTLYVQAAKSPEEVAALVVEFQGKIDEAVG